MTTRLLHVLLRTALVAALCVSAVLYVEYAASEPRFCGAQGGCGAVRASEYSAVWGVGLPTIGLGVFLGVFALALWASRREHFAFLAVVCGFGAAIGLGLIALQLFVLRAVCQWCMAIDIAAVVAAPVSVFLASRPPEPEAPRTRFLWGAVGLAAVALPLLWQPPPPEAEVPPAITQRHVPDKVNVVMFTDFECPHCRALHPFFEELKTELGDRLHVERMMMPLSFHPGAEPAARGYLCTPPELRDQMARHLYEAMPQDLTPNGVGRIATELGLDLRSFGRCMDAATTDEQLENDREIFRAAGLRGLPATIVGREVITGAQPDAVRAAVQRAENGGGGGLRVEWMLLAIGLATTIAAVLSLRHEAVGEVARP
jgi:predicted DsbA family dithiol-disulfide isomerase/uncharacterized membrane protein